MKRRYRLPLTLCSLALLAFSLYLNFVKKDVPEMPVPNAPVQPAPAGKPDKEMQKAVGHKPAAPFTTAAR